ncbi:hypothetical protein ACIPY2_19890 [Paenarthrobacter sp. NPDC089675]|uniref:hypothetical protein n=1 Tax=Paenarthrobacter TaxID=1742992 RepID=UPI0037F23F70
MTSKTLLPVDKVFVPGLDSEYTHVERDNAPQVAKIRQYVHQKGYLIPVVGPTKMGKTVLVTRTVPDAFYIDGSWITEAQDFWVRLAAKLDIPTSQNGSRTNGDTSKWGFKAKLDLILGSAESQFGGEHSRVIAKGWTSDIPADQAVTAAIKALNEVDQSAVIIIDDFHYMPPSVRAHVVASLKGLCANGATGVLITLPHHRNEAVTQIQDMIGRNKVATLEGWTPSELEEIAKLGFKKLNLVDPNGSFGQILAQESYGSPQLMQALCLSFVRDVNAIKEEQQEPTELVAPESWSEFFQEQVDERAFEWLETLVFGPPVRGQDRRVFDLQDGRKLDGYQLIFAALKAGGPVLSTKVRDLKHIITTQLLVNGAADEYARLNATTKLKQLTKIASRTLSAQHEDDLENEDDDLPTVAQEEALPNNKHQPLFEFTTRRSGEIDILEPYLAYALKWASDGLLI